MTCGLDLLTEQVISTTIEVRHIQVKVAELGSYLFIFSKLHQTNDHDGI